MIKLNKINLFVTAMFINQLLAAVVLVGIQLYTGVAFGTASYLVLGQLLTVLLPVVVYCAVTRANLRETFPMKLISPRNCLYVILLSVLAVPSMQFLSLLSSLLFPNQVSTTVSGLFGESSSIFIPLLAIAFVPAFFEELTMRGVVFAGCKGLSLRTIALLNGMYFGLMHLNLQQLPYAFLLGAVFAAIRYYTRSLISTMLAHFTINGVSLFLSFAALGFADETTAAAAEPIGSGSIIVAIVVYALVLLPPSILLFYFTFRSFRSYNRKRELATAPDFELVVSENKPAIVDVLPVTRLKLITPSFVIMLVTYILLTMLVAYVNG